MSNIKEIAQLACVSTCTVSRYLNHKIVVTEETENRIKSAIAQVGYVPSSVARSLKTNQTMNIAVILPTIDNLYYPQILTGISRVLDREDYAMVVHLTDEYRGVDEKCFRRVYASRADGVILVGYQRRHDQHSHLNEFIKAKIPVVMVNRSIPGPHIPVVYPSYETAGQMAAQRLWGQGRRKLGLVSFKAQYNLPILQTESYLRQAALLSGAPVDEKNIFFRDGRLDSHGSDGSLCETPAFLEHIVTQLHAGALDGLFVIDEMLAAYLIKLLTQHGIRVPEDLSVVGFGNTFFATVTTPTLTSIDLRNTDSGAMGAEVLLKQLKREPFPMETTLEPILIQRESG